MSDKTNIVLIMTDTQGVNVVGCYGRPEMKTPNLDRLAAEGVRFDKAYTCQPVCGPARSSIFTGNYPHTTGAWANSIPLGANVRTIGRRLKDNGYQTVYIGKWHLSGTGQFDNGVCPSEWDPNYWYDGRCYLEELTKKEKVLRNAEDFYNLNSAEIIHERGITEDLTFGHRCSKRAINFLQKHTGESPFFLVVSYYEPHWPFTCPPPYCDMFKDFDYRIGENVHDPLTNKPQHQKEWANSPHFRQVVERLRLKRPMYFGCNSFVDYEIGKVLDTVEECSPESLIIFTSDHGTPLSSHGLATKGPAMYEEITRIPFIVRWKEYTPKNTVCLHPVSHINIVPTLLDVAGIDIPPFIEGKSILPTLHEPEKRINDFIFIEFSRYEVNMNGWGGFQPIRCVFDGRYKLVINLHYTDELYDLVNDPQEMDNLIDSIEHREFRDNLHDRILEWMNETRDPFRGPVWERRPWKKKRSMGWAPGFSYRPPDGYEPDDEVSKLK